MVTILACIAAYLIGAISFSYIITKIVKKVDIRQFGSGNAGATNTLRVLGKGPAATVLILDILKGVLAILIAMALNLEDWAVALCGFLAILGHVYPVYFGFRGGKGVATTIAVYLMLMWLPALVAGAIAIILIAITRFVSLGSLAFILTPIVALIIGGYPNSYIIVTALISLLVIWKHRSNIVRIINGEESKIGSKVSS